MNILAMFGHVDALPIIYGLAIFVGMLIILVKIKRGWWLGAIIDVLVFWFVFTLHGGTMTGALAATIAALLAGLVFPIFLRR